MRLLGTLVSGLGYDSRLQRERRGEDYSLNTMLLASIADSVNVLVYGFFNKKKGERPASFVEALTEKETESEYVAFEDGDELMEYMQKLREA